MCLVLISLLKKCANSLHPAQRTETTTTTIGILVARATFFEALDPLPPLLSEGGVGMVGVWPGDGGIAYSLFMSEQRFIVSAYQTLL